jgi:predicted Zn-dependent protease
MTYRFAILDTDIVGAYALPGGYIFITRAAIFNMRNETQLAGALGHEVVHAAERHLEKEIRGKKTSAWAAQEGLAADKSGGLTKLCHPQLRGAPDGYFRNCIRRFHSGDCAG